MLELNHATVRYGDVLAVNDVSLSVAAMERIALLGPSGSGKSTLLRAVAGLEPLVSGTITWNGQDLAAVAVHERGFGLMFQDYVLFPHRDVAGNVAFGLEIGGQPRALIRARVDEVLALVGLGGYGQRHVTELSGGEQQRVALARALAPNPRLLMLDEPLGALDRTLREQLLGELLELFDRLEVTILYVTHDQEEALAVGERVAVMRAGRLETVAAPQELWRNPPSEFVARFLGLKNICDAVVSNGRATTPWAELDVPAGTPDGPARLLLRPEAVQIGASGEAAGVVVSSTFRGSRTVVVVGFDGAPSLEVHAPPGVAPRLGETVRLNIPPEAVVVLTSGHRARLSE